MTVKKGQLCPMQPSWAMTIYVLKRSLDFTLTLSNGKIITPPPAHKGDTLLLKPSKHYHGPAKSDAEVLIVEAK